MLEAIQELGDSVSHSQIRDLKSTLGDELYGLLDSAFDAETEVEAKKRIDAFVSAAKENKLRMLKARRILDKEQKSLIMKFLKD